MPILTRADLDAAQCATPDCRQTGHGLLWLHATCHPHAGVQVAYEAGVLYLLCQVCQQGVVRIAVQGRLED